MSEFSELISDGHADSIEAMGDSFTWNNKPYAAIIDHVERTVTTLKSLFPDKAYPKCGQAIIVAGRKFQITKKGNAQIKAVAGGFIEDPPFVDDPGEPALDITFDSFIKK